jgi:hypothetical protein
MDIKKPNRATRTYTQKLVAGPDRVFSLLCPVREADWIEGWDPVAVWSASGVAEPDCVFMTQATPDLAIWFITRHEQNSGYVEMLKIVPEMTACKLSIQLTATPAGCEATITYSHTSLGARGDAFVASFTEEFYVEFMRDWEARMNHFLETGEALKTAR